MSVEITEGYEDLDAYGRLADAWLAARLAPREVDDEPRTFEIFPTRSASEERELLAAAAAWQRDKFESGYGAISWSPEVGGAGLTASHEQLFRELESRYSTPERHENLQVTVDLVAPAIALFGTDEQKERFLKPLLRAEELCCQLFSEPGAGSDLAGVSTRAEFSDGRWLVNGQKVWSSGARLVDWGILIARTDPTVPKHQGLTAFMVPMNADGIEVRPIKQMTGGSSFNEVFFTDVAVSDDDRLGAVGDGWRVTLAVLGFERSSTGVLRDVGGNMADLVRLAERLERSADPLVRQQVADAYVHDRAATLLSAVYAERERSGAVPGAEGSIAKLIWTTGLRRISHVASAILGRRLLADSGEPETFAWTAHVLGAPGFRIAGGSDEIQHNIIGERALGLPRDPKVAA